MRNYFIEEFRKFTFTKNQKKIAQYCIDQQYYICKKTLHEVATEVGVSEVTVLSFVRKLGYEGFAAFKDHVYECMRTDYDYQQGLSQRLESNRRSRADIPLIENHMRVAMNNMEQTLGQNSPELYDQVVNNILQAKHVFVAGARSVYGEAWRFARALNYLANHVTLLTNDYVGIIQALNSAQKDDVLVLFCVSRFYKTDTSICRTAKERGMKLILFSDSAISPIAVYADHLFVMESKSLSFFNSAVGLTVLYEYLIALIADKVGDDVKARWDAVDAYTKEFRY